MASDEVSGTNSQRRIELKKVSQMCMLTET